MPTKLFSRSLLKPAYSNAPARSTKQVAYTPKSLDKKTNLVLVNNDYLNTSHTTQQESVKQPHPSVIRNRTRFLILEKLNECRILRAIDVAAYVFGDRPSSAALTAAQRALRGLYNDKLIKRLTSDRHQVFYVLTKLGADWLNGLLLQNDPEIAEELKANSSTRWANNLTNPEHLMYCNFIKLCCLSRGLDACDEGELTSFTTSLNSRSENIHSLGLMEVKSSKGGKKQLRPDVLSYNDKGAVWFEIDKSARGEDRRSDLTNLFRSVGHKLSREVNWLGEEQQILSHVVIFAYSKGIFNTASRLLRASFPGNTHIEDDTQEDNIHRQSVCIINDDTKLVFELWEKRLDFSDKAASLRHFKGYVSIQMIPPWLIGTSSKSLVDNQEWFSNNYLPYARPQGWKKPKNIIHPGAFQWENYGLA